MNGEQPVCCLVHPEVEKRPCYICAGILSPSKGSIIFDETMWLNIPRKMNSFRGKEVALFFNVLIL